MTTNLDDPHDVGPELVDYMAAAVREVKIFVLHHQGVISTPTIRALALLIAENRALIAQQARMLATMSDTVKEFADDADEILTALRKH